VTTLATNRLYSYSQRIIKGKKLSIYREQERRIRVRIKIRLPKEGINRIDNKEALKLILYIYSNRSSNIDQKSSYIRWVKSILYCCSLYIKTKEKE
jgi:hypothetical protein